MLPTLAAQECDDRRKSEGPSMAPILKDRSGWAAPRCMLPGWTCERREGVLRLAERPVIELRVCILEVSADTFMLTLPNPETNHE